MYAYGFPRSSVSFLDHVVGHVDPGETDMQTALRETEEEAGFLREDLKIFEDAKQELNYNVDNKPKTVIYWLAELINKNKDARLSSEHQEFKWLKLEEACQYARYKDLQETLNHFDVYIREKVL